MEPEVNALLSLLVRARTTTCLPLAVLYLLCAGNCFLEQSEPVFSTQVHPSRRCLRFQCGPAAPLPAPSCSTCATATSGRLPPRQRKEGRRRLPR